LIDRVAAQLGLAVDRLLKSSLLCVALHDVGKLTTNFQRMMRATDDKAYRDAQQRNYRHEIAGLPFVLIASRALAQTFGQIPGGGLLEAMAVAGHHKFLAPDYLFDESRFLNGIEWEHDVCGAIESASGLAEAMFQDQHWHLRLPKLSSNDVQMLKNHGINYPFKILTTTSDVLAKATSSQKSQFRDLFILLKGLLMTADWMASGLKDAEGPLQSSGHFLHVASGALSKHLRAKVERDRQERNDSTPYEGFRPFQEECGLAEGHVLAIAPTGSGKTEAACLWALRQAEQGRARKLFFLLPTMVTANSVQKRLVEFFETKQGHHVGLVHSTAELINNGMEGNDADRADVRADYLSESHFFPPVVVGTVDQLLVTLFHAGRWAMKTLAAADAAIVIDEIHAYDPHTAGLLVFLIEQLRDLGARFLVMSATMPKDLQTTIRKALEREAGACKSAVSFTLVEDKKFTDSARNFWSVCETPLTEWLTTTDRQGKPIPSDAFRELWRDTNERGEPIKILVVVNTVKRCQDLAKALREFRPVCYHSKFIFRDRCEKERRILDCKPYLLIATQVVEVSLELDYDVMLTECATFDALVQRAGRVNRFRRPVLGRIVVHPPEAGSEKVYGEPPGVLEASWDLCREHPGALTERDLLGLVEGAYDGRVLSDVAAYRNIQARVKNQQARLAGVLDNPRPDEEDLKTRLESYPQVSVIPEPFFETVARQSDPRRRRLYELKVPVWYARTHKHKGDNPDDLPVCLMNYDAEYGGQLLAGPDHPEPGHEII
jgi:CRISPR-associated endonuclease/helicase Cas3